jgi:hypothetical protein
MIQNSTEFNEKWVKYLEPRFYGMAIEHPLVLKYMDEEFEKETTTNPDFTYSQLKLKFGTARVYTTSAHNNEWEETIDKLIKEPKI